MDVVHLRGDTDNRVELTASETELEAKAVWSCLCMMNSRFARDFKTVLGSIVTLGKICSAAPNPAFADGCSGQGRRCGVMQNVHYV